MREHERSQAGSGRKLVCSERLSSVLAHPDAAGETIGFGTSVGVTERSRASRKGLTSPYGVEVGPNGVGRMSPTHGPETPTFPT
jgi:hypothetical protein